MIELNFPLGISQKHTNVMIWKIKCSLNISYVRKVNVIAIVQNILESVFINGLWSAWGPMGVYFKANDFFVDECRLEGLNLNYILLYCLPITLR